MTDPAEPVTVLLSRTVRRGSEAEFEQALATHLEQVQTLAGHLGVNVFRPAAGARDWTCIFKFDTGENLEAWKRCSEKLAWEEAVFELTDGPPRVQAPTGLETWFTLPDLGVVAPPPRWKVALVTWVAIYPTITALLLLFGSQLESLPVPTRTLLLTGVLVPLMTFLLMPVLTARLRSWLYDTPR